MKGFFALSALLLLATGCAQPNNNGEDQTNWLNQAVNLFSVQPYAKQLKVVAQNGKPVIGAQILIGSDLNQPFADNFVSTDSSGGFTAPNGWTRQEAVTINAPGFVRATYLKQMPTGQTFTLRPIEGGNLFQLNGATTGHNVKDFDGIVDFGLVIPAISKAGFFNLDISDFISTDTDTITVAGKSMALPSNITLPTQQESYFITLTLDKPSYRLNFKSNGIKTVFAAKGQFPLDDMVNAYQSGKQIFELANVFAMAGGVMATFMLQGNQPVHAQEEKAGRVEATEFRLLDDKGNVRASMGTADNGSVTLTFFDKDLKPRMQIGADGEQASMSFLDGEGTPRYIVAQRNKGNDVMVTFQDSKGKPRYIQSLTKEGAGCWRFAARKNRTTSR